LNVKNKSGQNGENNTLERGGKKAAQVVVLRNVDPETHKLKRKKKGRNSKEKEIFAGKGQWHTHKPEGPARGQL